MILRSLRVVALATMLAAPASAQVRGTGDDVVRTARRYLGVPYRLGGDTPRAFDLLHGPRSRDTWFFQRLVAVRRLVPPGAPSLATHARSAALR